MTIIMAAQTYDDRSAYPQYGENAALSWQESDSWGQTFLTPRRSSTNFRFGTSQPDNTPQYFFEVEAGGDFVINTAIHKESVDSLYVNGVLALRQRSKLVNLAGTTGLATIGAGSNNTFFTGNIGEILIYDRALPTRDREKVERYLRAKYGIH
jgi:Concanavalin A-like lectin/glucanases superfamily